MTSTQCCTCAVANELVVGSAHAGLQALRERFHSSVAPLVDQADRDAASARQAVDQAAELDQQLPNQGDDVGVGPEDGASEQSATTESLQAVNEQHRSVTEELRAQVSLDGAVPCLCCRQPIPHASSARLQVSMSDGEVAGGRFEGSGAADPG